jgi:hypothetical protein
VSFTDSNGLIHYPGCADICGNHPHDPLEYQCRCVAPKVAKGRQRVPGYRTCVLCQAPIVTREED